MPVDDVTNQRSTKPQGHPRLRDIYVDMLSDSDAFAFAESGQPKSIRQATKVRCIATNLFQAWDCVVLELACCWGIFDSSLSRWTNWGKNMILSSVKLFAAAAKLSHIWLSESAMI